MRGVGGRESREPPCLGLCFLPAGKNNGKAVLELLRRKIKRSAQFRRSAQKDRFRIFLSERSDPSCRHTHDNNKRRLVRLHSTTVAARHGDCGRNKGTHCGRNFGTTFAALSILSLEAYCWLHRTVHVSKSCRVQAVTPTTFKTRWSDGRDGTTRCKRVYITKSRGHNTCLANE